MLQLHPYLNHQRKLGQCLGGRWIAKSVLFGWIFKDVYITPAALSPGAESYC